jgi:hypothetical protein
MPTAFCQACALQRSGAWQETFAGYLSKREFYDHEYLAKKAMKAAIGLIRYLESTPDPE